MITTARSELVIATTNAGKLAEFRALLAHSPVVVRGLSDVLPASFRVVEDGATFEANAKKKASEVAAASHLLTLADDSGLEVDALGGRPGVRSARFAGEHATDAENNAALLDALRALPESAMTTDARFPARFRCALALVCPFTHDGEPFVASGTCEGAIALSPRGSGGFGYDPLFLVTGASDTRSRTLAELSDEEKNAVSHRSRAMARLVPVLERVLVARTEAARRIAGE